MYRLIPGSVMSCPVALRAWEICQTPTSGTGFDWAPLSLPTANSVRMSRNNLGVMTAPVRVVEPDSSWLNHRRRPALLEFRVEGRGTALHQLLELGLDPRQLLLELVVHCDLLRGRRHICAAAATARI